MRWLLICLIVSLVALLLASAGMARHIWLRRAGRRSGQAPGGGLFPREDRSAILDAAGETDAEPEL